MGSERDISGGEERRWKAIASRLALTFTVCIMLGGAWGSWLDRKNRGLEGTVKTLQSQNELMMEQLTDYNELSERNKELEKKVFDLSVKNAMLEAMLESSKVKNDPTKE